MISIGSVGPFLLLAHNSQHIHNKFQSKKFGKYDKQKALSNSTGNIAVAVAANRPEKTEDMSSLVIISESEHEKTRPSASKARKAAAKARSKKPLAYSTKQIDLARLPDQQQQQQQAVAGQPFVEQQQQQYASVSSNNYAKYLAGKSNLNLKSDFNFNRKSNGKPGVGSSSSSSHNLHLRRDQEASQLDDPYISFQTKMSKIFVNKYLSK